MGINENYFIFCFPNKINIIDIESVFFADNSIHAHFSHIACFIVTLAQLYT